MILNESLAGLNEFTRQGETRADRPSSQPVILKRTFAVRRQYFVFKGLTVETNRRPQPVKSQRC